MGERTGYSDRLRSRLIGDCLEALRIDMTPTEPARPHNVEDNDQVDTWTNEGGARREVNKAAAFRPDFDERANVYVYGNSSPESVKRYAGGYIMLARVTLAHAIRAVMEDLSPKQRAHVLIVPARTAPLEIDEIERLYQSGSFPEP
jgi:hypothetical protein